jgi:uncharacterized protein YcfL
MEMPKGFVFSIGKSILRSPLINVNRYFFNKLLMKSITIVLIASLLLLACSSEPKTGEVKKNNETSTDSSKPVPPALQQMLDERAATFAFDTTLFVPHNITEDKVGAGIQWKGAFRDAWYWYDNNGKNILILSSSNTVVHEAADISSGELFAKQYAVKKGKDSPVLLWELYDFKNDCDFDLTCNFLGAPDISDADKNGIMESSIIYTLACRSDASPAEMKIIMHEGKKKYALRGTTALRVNGYPDSLYSEERTVDLSTVSADQIDGMSNWGRFKNADDFQTAPPVFLKKAIELWKENRIEE